MTRAGNESFEEPKATPGYPLEELHERGVLWAINSTLFWPRGYSLQLNLGKEGEVHGWWIAGTGAEPWLPSSEEMATKRFEAFEAHINYAHERNTKDSE